MILAQASRKSLGFRRNRVYEQPQKRASRKPHVRRVVYGSRCRPRALGREPSGATGNETRKHILEREEDLGIAGDIVRLCVAFGLTLRRSDRVRLNGYAFIWYLRQAGKMKSCLSPRLFN